jgi:hypothetical protein
VPVGEDSPAPTPQAGTGGSSTNVDSGTFAYPRKAAKPKRRIRRTTTHLQFGSATKLEVVVESKSVVVATSSTELSIKSPSEIVTASATVVAGDLVAELNGYGIVVAREEEELALLLPLVLS